MSDLSKREERPGGGMNEWKTYACTKCKEETNASSSPPYCPVCETWGVMDG